jgi:uncharacterized membrane protein YkvA (DUF1232 family)
MSEENDDLREKILRDIEEAEQKIRDDASGDSSDANDDDIRSEVTVGPVSEDRASRYYDKIRKKIRDYVESKGETLGKAADYLLVAPDVFILLWRLVQDPRVGSKDKVLLGTGVAYYIFPFDLLPEAIMGPMGYAEDLIFGVLILAKVLKDTPVEVVEEHWSGDGELLAMVRNVLRSAENLVSQDVLERLRRMAK